MEGDSEGSYAHYALHKLNIRPGILAGKSPLDIIDRKERAFIYASIDLKVEADKREMSK